MNYLTAGVLGHVDHGKTALVRALTGVETDRLKEERERGISIALGFADLALPAGRLAFVDAPGHERFVRTMISGATGIGAAILVVDANEGVRRQTRENFDIAKLLEIPAGVAVVTKCDTADAARIEETERDIRALVAGSFLDSAIVVRTSALTGTGLDRLREILNRLVEAARPVADEGSAYLPVDRVFSMSGFGTVVTGTLRRGALADGDEVQLYPGDARARVRQIESHGEHVTRGLPGRRTAVNLRGVEKSDLRRGSVLATPGSIQPAAIVDVSLSLLPGLERPLAARETVRLLFGTSELLVRPRLFDRDELAPGESCVAQLEAREPVPFLVRERFVLRTESPVTTIGGGTFLGASAKRRPRTAASLVALETLAAGNLGRIIQLRLTETEEGILDVARFALAHCFSASDVQRAASELGLATLPDGRVASAEAAARLVPRAPEWPGLSPAEQRVADEIEVAFKRGGLEPPSIADAVGPDRERNRLYRHLVDAGVLVPMYAQTKPKTLANTIVLHRDSIVHAQELLCSKLRAGGGFQTQDAKAVLGVSRKYLIPLLEYFDQQRFTRRRGELREFVDPVPAKRE